jgi:pimeloyl-ACP methyl ester carboxylesterase
MPPEASSRNRLPSAFPNPELLNTTSTPKTITPSRKLNTTLVQSLRARRNTPLDKALETLTGDIVLLGGYRGSVLTTPQGQELWPPVYAAHQPNLGLTLCPEEDVLSEDSVVATGLLQSAGKVDFAGNLLKKLKGCENARSGKLRVWEWGYDWRVGPGLISERFVKFLEGLPCNRPQSSSSSYDEEHKAEIEEPSGALVIAHSLGGVITRHAVNVNPKLFSGVVYAGVPQSCISILGPFREGDPASFLGHRVLDAEVHFSLRTAYAFLPEDGECFVDGEGKKIPVDFYDVEDWVKYRLSPCIAPPVVPRAGGGMVQDGHVFKTKMPVPLHLQRRNTIHAFPTTPQSQPRKRFPHQPTNKSYLRRILSSTKAFRSQLAHDPALEKANAYPPIVILYSDSTPTVSGLKVPSPSSITAEDAFEEHNRVHAPGDGVVVAELAMPPREYKIVKDGVVRSGKGHMTLLGDLATVGKAIGAVMKGRERGVGRGGIVDDEADAFES